MSFFIGNGKKIGYLTGITRPAMPLCYLSNVKSFWLEQLNSHKVYLKL